MMLKDFMSILLSPILAPTPHPMYLVRMATTMIRTASSMTDVLVRELRSTCRPTLRKKKDSMNVVIESNLCSRSHSQA